MREKEVYRERSSKQDEREALKKERRKDWFGGRGGGEQALRGPGWVEGSRERHGMYFWLVSLGSVQLAWRKKQ
jgi:hypothetical protein